MIPVRFLKELFEGGSEDPKMFRFLGHYGSRMRVQWLYIHIINSSSCKIDESNVQKIPQRIVSWEFSLPIPLHHFLSHIFSFSITISFLCPPLCFSLSVCFYRSSSVCLSLPVSRSIYDSIHEWPWSNIVTNLCFCFYLKMIHTKILSRPIAHYGSKSNCPIEIHLLQRYFTRHKEIRLLRFHPGPQNPVITFSSGTRKPGYRSMTR